MSVNRPTSAATMKSAPRPRRGSTPAAMPLGERMLAGLREAIEAERSGEPLERRFTVRTVKRPPPEPADYSARKVRATRDLIGASQTIFASLLGISTVLEQSWEQGFRKPSKLARRLLDEINRHPQRWRSMIG